MNTNLLVQILTALLALAFGYGTWQIVRTGKFEYWGVAIKKADQPKLFWLGVAAGLFSALVLGFMSFTWSLPRPN